jgi:hypothetical protein
MRIKVVVTRNVLLVAVALISLLSAGSRSPLIAQQEITSSTKAQPGLKTAVFETPKGKINVNLPDDMAATDEISGTVVAEAAGKTPEEKAQNEDELNGYVVEIAKTEEPPKPEAPKKHAVPKAKPTDPGFVCMIPPAAEVIKLILRGPKGTPVCTSEMPCLPKPPAQSCGPSECVMPTVGTCGRPVQIKGPCDGSFTNSGVMIGGQKAPILAESPRQQVAKSPTSVVGPTEIQRTEGQQVTKGTFRNLKVKMAAQKLGLQKGETTTVTIRVEGLKGITEPVRLQIENRSPDVVTMSNGNSQVIIIRPEDVPGDTYVQ